MVHIYGHTWPVRWGNAKEQKMVKVYSNCDEAELFVNGKSYGVKERNSQDFPAAGLRWMVNLNEGNNVLRVVAKSGKVILEDEIMQQYLATKWETPKKLIVEKIREDADTITIQAKLVDERNIPCLDACNWIYFSLAGDGELIDKLGTSSGSGKVQAYNGRAVIRVKNKGKSIICVQSPDIPTVFLNIEKKQGTP
jgi:beta-galactosidase